MPAPGRDSGRSVDAVADLIFGIAGWPVHSCAEFYALYYLAEIENDPDARVEFPFRRSQIRDGLYWYTVYALLSELSTGVTHYYIEGDFVGDLESGGRTVIDEHASDLAREVAERDDLDANERSVLTRSFERFFINMGALHDVRGFGRENATRVLEVGDERLGTPGAPVRQPQDFVRNVERFFWVTPSPAASPSEFRDAEMTGWLPQYQGDAWTAIAEHAIRLGDEVLPDTSWVDQTWAIEHNNSNFLDKIDVTPQARRELADIRGSVFGDDVGPDVSDSVARHILIELLDAARETEMDLVFTYAGHLETGSSVTDLVELQRKAAQYGIRVMTADPLPVAFTEAELDALDEFGRVYRGWPGSRHSIWEATGAVPSQDAISELATLAENIFANMDPAIGRVSIERTEAEWRQHRRVIDFAYRYATNETIREILSNVDVPPMSIRQADVLRQLDGKLTQAVGMSPG